MPEWIRSETDQRAVDEGCWFDEAAALYVVEFFERFLKHTLGQWAGQPFKLLDWQRDDIVMPLFGWKRADGTRRYRKAYIEVPKKNGKSTLCGGLALYLLIADNEPRAQIFGAAADREQAGIVFGEAANMVQASGQLSRKLDVIKSTKRIIDKRTNSFFHVGCALPKLLQFQQFSARRTSCEGTRLANRTQLPRWQRKILPISPSPFPVRLS